MKLKYKILYSLLMVSYLPLANAVYVATGNNSRDYLSANARNNLKKLSAASNKLKIGDSWMFNAGYQVQKVIANGVNTYYVLMINKEDNGVKAFEYLIVPSYALDDNFSSKNIVLNEKIANSSLVLNASQYQKFSLLDNNLKAKFLSEEGKPVNVIGDLLEISAKKFPAVPIKTIEPNFTVQDYTVPLTSRVKDINSYLENFRFNVNLFEQIKIEKYDAFLSKFNVYKYNPQNEFLKKEFDDYLFLIPAFDMSRNGDIDEEFKSAILIRYQDLESIFKNEGASAYSYISQMKKTKLNLETRYNSSYLDVMWTQDNVNLIARDIFTDKENFRRAVKRGNQFYVPKYLVDKPLVSPKYSISISKNLNKVESYKFELTPANELEWRRMSPNQYKSSNKELFLKESLSDSNLENYYIISSQFFPLKGKNVVSETEPVLKIIHKDDIYLLFDKYLSLVLWYYLPSVDTDKKESKKINFEFDEKSYEFFLQYAKNTFSDDEYLKSYKLNRLKKQSYEKTFVDVDIYSKGNLGKIIVPVSINQLPETVVEKDAQNTNKYLSIYLMYPQFLFSPSDKLNDLKSFN